MSNLVRLQCPHCSKVTLYRSDSVAGQAICSSCKASFKIGAETPSSNSQNAAPPDRGGWYYTDGSDRFGPLQFGQLVSAATAGKLDPNSTLVWQQGMPDWIAANKVDGLFSAQSFPNSPSRHAQMPKSGPGNGLLTAFTILVPVQIVVYALSWIWYLSEGDDVVLSLLSFLSFTILVAAKAVFLVWLYRTWSDLPRELRPYTPSALIGYLFIPFYNVYWVFTAIVGLSKSLQRGLQTDSQADPPMTGIGLAIAFAITSIPSLLLLDLLSHFLATLPLVLGLAWMHITNHAKRKLLGSA